MLRKLCMLAVLAPMACSWAGGRDGSVDPVADFIEILEMERAEAGCAEPLIWDDAIAEVAQRHTVDMMVSSRMRHVSPDGEDVASRLERGGVRFLLASENLAAGPVRGKRVFQLWYNSPGHRRNMLNCVYTHHGVGYRHAYWTHVLVRYTP